MNLIRHILPLTDPTVLRQSQNNHLARCTFATKQWNTDKPKFSWSLTFPCSAQKIPMFTGFYYLLKGRERKVKVSTCYDDPLYEGVPNHARMTHHKTRA